MMNTIITLLITLFMVGQLFAQETLIDKNGITSFFSEAPMEDIEAENNEVVGAINLEKGTLAATMLVKNFHFDNSLMEEHFNENYMESDQYPKANFKGKITDFTLVDFNKPGIYEVNVEGEMEIHGVSRQMATKVKLEVTTTNIKVSTSFKIRLADHEIKIPRLVVKNIAEEVEVKSIFNFIRQ